MGKRIMTDILIIGTAITGVIMAVQFALEPHAFMATLALINLATALFLAVVVRPLLRGKVSESKVLPHLSMLVLLGAWGAAFWIEYLTLTHLPSALAGAITWSAAALIYLGDLLVSAQTEEAPAPEPTRELQTAGPPHA